MMFRKTVDGVMTAFSKAIRDLQEVREERTVEADRQQQIVLKAVTDRQEAMAEAARAERLIGKLTELTQ